jgi:predicted acylesterase/phospholipase RssA
MQTVTQDVALYCQFAASRPHNVATKLLPNTGAGHLVSGHDERSRTAFVFAGGGSFGAIHVGMLHSLASRGIAADMDVGSSLGALNGAYYAGNPTIEGIQRWTRSGAGCAGATCFR